MCKLDHVTHKLNEVHKSNMQIKMESLQCKRFLQNNLQKTAYFSLSKQIKAITK